MHKFKGLYVGPDSGVRTVGQSPGHGTYSVGCGFNTGNILTFREWVWVCSKLVFRSNSNFHFSNVLLSRTVGSLSDCWLCRPILYRARVCECSSVDLVPPVMVIMGYVARCDSRTRMGIIPGLHRLVIRFQTSVQQPPRSRVHKCGFST